MSLFGALNSATSGLRLIQSNIQVVSDNVSRSNDPNRTRHVLERTTDKSGTVTIAQYTRRSDVQLRSQLETSISEDKGAQTLADYMRRIGDLLGTTSGKPGLSDAVDKFAQAWRDLEASPESSVAAGQVVLHGDDLAREIRRVAEGVEDVAAQMDRDIRQTVTDLNQNLADIDELNDNIVALRGARQPTMELEDRRDSLIRKVAEITSVRVVEREGGKVALFTPTGLALCDAAPNRIIYDQGRLVSANSGSDISQHLREGKLGALLELSADHSDAEPPRAASLTPTSEVIRKLRSQLDQLTSAFTQPARPGEPASFQEVYDRAGPTNPGELKSGFFKGSSRLTIAINEDLLSGAALVKQSAIADAAGAIAAPGRTFAADGIVATDVTYSGMVSHMMGSWTTGESDAKTRAKATSEFKTAMESRYQSTSGVNLDEEIADLQVLQRNYSATARVMQVVSAMFDALERIG